jgi:rubrerythrin
MSAIDTLKRSGFLAHALAIENEAVERYTTFAGQMDVTNNREVADLFREMARLEQLHASELEDRIGEAKLPEGASWEFDWPHGESPEAVDFSDTHYLMTPYQALTLVLQAEQRAVEFFEHVEQATGDDDVRKMAAEFAEEEREHVDLVRKWRDRYPPPEHDWDHDPDPPNQLE